ncbi:MAG: prolipoprotein diacylglyceryl transferase [Sandaracinaceae bacterium]
MNWGIDPTLIGPHELPWHLLLGILDVGTIVFLLYSWRKSGQLNSEQWMWPALALGGHVLYTLRLAEANPTFELEIRYYGLFFAVGLLLAARAFPVYFERWGFPREHAEGLTLWTPIGMLLGAHFIHLIFYEPEAFLNNPIRIFQLGSGLASHGGGLGAIVAVIWYCRRQGINPMKYMDPSMCAATFVIPWVRVGNFFNSEIVGRVWDGPWAVGFLRHYEVVDGRAVYDCPGFLRDGTICADPENLGQLIDPITRHPSQAYEAILGFIMVGIAIYLQRRWRNRLRPGAILFILLAYYFTTRFLIEYVKNYQAVESDSLFTMGQMLSLPIVAVSLYMLFFSKTSNIRTTIAGPEVIDNPPPFLHGKAEDTKPAEKSAPKASEPDVDDALEADGTTDDDPPAPKKRRKKKKKRKS